MADVKNLLAQFDDISKNPQRLLKEYLNAGDKVIACFPVYTPIRSSLRPAWCRWVFGAANATPR